MTIQIFGSRKCFDTRKAERFFKERRIKYQYVDLLKYGLSKGEFESVKASVGLNALINTEAKEYQKLNLHRIRGMRTREEIILQNPRLYETPIVRNKGQATVGYQPETWNDWV